MKKIDIEKIELKKIIGDLKKASVIFDGFGICRCCQKMRKSDMVKRRCF